MWPQRGHREIRRRDGLRDNPHPPGVAGGQRRAARRGHPAGPQLSRANPHQAPGQRSPNRAAQPTGQCRHGLCAQGRPAAAPGAALPGTLQGGGEEPQVLPPGHRRQDAERLRGPAEATHRSSSNNPSSPATERPPPSGPDRAGTFSNTSGPVDRPASHSHRQTGPDQKTAQQISTLTALKALGGVM
jgi:hypothetical protein